MDKIQEVFNKKRIPICFSANTSFIPYTTVMIQSIIDNSSIDNNYDIIILHTEIDSNLQTMVKSLAENRANISIRFYDISSYMKSVKLFTKSVYTGTTYTNEAYYRLLIPTLMPDYDKVLYFDGDMLALSDVAELYYSTDMTGYMLASSRDYAGICNCYIEGDPRREYRQNILGLKNIDNYIISGMLVMNPSEFNKRYTGEQLLEICASRDWRQHDQDVLNVVCEDSLLIISGSWDYMEDYGNTKFLPTWLREEYEATALDIKVVHYAGPRKPWKFNNSFKSDEFWLTCFKTPFFKSMIDNLYKNYGYKNSILQLLYNKKPEISYSVGDAYVSNGDFFIGQMSDIYTKIEYFTYVDGVFTIDGFFNLIGVEENELVNIYLSIDRKLHKCEVTNRDCSEYKFGRLLYRGVPFRTSVKIDPKKPHTIKIVAKIKENHYVVNKNLRFGSFCALNDLKNKYYFVRNVIFTTDKQTISMKPAGQRSRIKHEINFLKTLKGWKQKLLRISYFIHNKLKRHQLWLISDRKTAAGDNGEALISYIYKSKPKNIKAYFVIDKDCDDYKRLKKKFKIVKLNSLKYKFYKIFADKIISSHLENQLANYSKQVYSDILMHQKNIFLQHGITKDDISSIYSKYVRNIDLFICAALPEYKSIINNENYGLLKDNVKITGFPRYDKLNDQKKKIISIIPTWRQYCLYLDKGKWIAKDNFKSTEYFSFYNSLLSNKKLISACKTYGYEIKFIPHILMHPFNKFFQFSNPISLEKSCNYSDIFNETSLLITDYSSTAFDVAYLNKPIIYSQFDKDKFFSSHTYSKGYYDYKNDGFGEVTYSIKETVDLLIDYMKNDCKIKSKYLERINNFFSFRDNKNSNRVLTEILKIKNN